MPCVTTYRPGGTRVVAYLAAALILVVAVAIGTALPENIVFTGSQVGTLVVIYLGILTALHGIGRSFFGS